MSQDSEVDEEIVLKDRFPNIEINRVLSKQLRVQELKEGETAVYKLIVSDYKDRSRKDQNDNELMCAPGMSLHHTCKVYDPIAKKTINIRNVTGYKFTTLPGGEERETPIFKRLIIPRGGTVTIPAGQVETYAWMERHNGNRDNAFRDKTKKPLFYRVNQVRQHIKNLENDYVLVDALNYVKNASAAQLKTIYEGLTKTAKLKIDASSNESLKLGIWNYTKINPILTMKASDNEDVRIKIQVMEAEHYNVIQFDEGDDRIAGAKRQWIFMDEKMTEICEVELGAHKIDGIIEFFKKKDGSGYKVYKKMTKLLDTVLNPK